MKVTILMVAAAVAALGVAASAQQAPPDTEVPESPPTDADSPAPDEQDSVDRQRDSVDRNADRDSQGVSKPDHDVEVQTPTTPPKKKDQPKPCCAAD